METYEQYIERSENKGKIPFKLFEKVKPTHVLVLAGLVYFGTKIMESSQGNNKWAYFIVGGLGVLYFFSLVKQEKNVKLIPRHIAQEIARRDLLHERNPEGSFVHGTKVTPSSNYKDQAWDSGEGPKIYKYNFGFKIKSPNQAPREIVYQMNPYTGDCKGIVEVPLGFEGEEIKDRQLIFPEKYIKEDKKEKTT